MLSSETFKLYVKKTLGISKCFSVESQILNLLGHKVSLTTIQLLLCSTQAVNMTVSQSVLAAGGRVR